VFENRVLRGLPKMDKVTEGWRKMHEELITCNPHWILK
jgi:hypothetical protein